MAQMDPLDKLDESTRRYRDTKAAHDEAQQEVVDDVVAALKAGKRPTDVVEHSPFTAAHVRKLARDNGIEPAPRGGVPKKK
ncbi:hypothetical protein [Nonomuraea typhae]|uniref:hypothetical protein n=1 Tax=Nonomuraea typhae TaxID=2603600 RepID=UPI0012F73E1C|nr:hypothetical protein [Nonomuraea typhae]